MRSRQFAPEEWWNLISTALYCFITTTWHCSLSLMWHCICLILTIHRAGQSANRTSFPPHGINSRKWKCAVIEPCRMQLCSCREEAWGNWYLCGFWSPCTVAISDINDAWLEVCSSHSLLRGCWKWDCAEVLMEHVLLKAMAWLILNSPMVCEQVIYYFIRQ